MTCSKTSVAVNDLGRRIYVLPGDRRGERLVESRGNVNPESLRMWRWLLRADSWDTIVDVGANYGEMLLGAELGRATQIVAFEPLPRVAAQLARSLAEADVPARVEVAAVGDATGTGVLVEDALWSGKSSMSAVQRPATGREVEVAVTTLDAYFREGRVGRLCVKIDVEGYEPRVLNGMTRLAREADHVAVMMEVLHLSRDEVQAVMEHWRVQVWRPSAGEAVFADCDAESMLEMLALEEVYAQDVVLTPRMPKHADERGGPSAEGAKG